MTGNYSYETGSMTGILGQLKWESLKKRRKDNILILLSSLLWWELGTNSLITGPGEWLSFRPFTSKLSWSWSWSFPTLIGYLPYLTITLPTQAKFPSLTWVPTLISPPHATLTTKHSQTCITLPHPTAIDWLNIRPKRLAKLGWNDSWGPKRPVTKARPDMQ